MRAPTVTMKRARALRRAMTLPEVIVWNALRGRRLDGLHFRKQHPHGPYILDFYCSAARLCVEVDGAGHLDEEQAEHDERRDAYLARDGIQVLRVSAVSVLDDRAIAIVLHEVLTIARSRLA